jgi:parallel beta-helix repeat protein
MPRPREIIGPPQPPRDPFTGSVINVREHGAKGDGTNDTRALRRIIGTSGEGDAIYFPPGRYVVWGPLAPKAHQLYFSLTDRATIEARRPGPGFPIFVIRAGPVEFRRLIVVASKAPSPDPQDIVAGILRPPDATGAVDVVVSDCRIETAHDDGIYIARGRDADRGSGRVIVRDSVVVGCRMNGLTLGHVDNVRVQSSRFERCNNGIKMRDCEDVVVHGVTADANRRHGIAFTFSHRWHVAECFARGNGSADDEGKDHGWGVAAGGEAAEGLVPNSDFTITNTICEDNVRGGITLDPTMEPTKIEDQRARVAGNLCRNGQGAHGIQVTHGSDVVVADNVCANNAGAGIQLVTSSHVLVQGNACFRNKNGIGVSNDPNVPNAGNHVIGVNLLHDNPPSADA